MYTSWNEKQWSVFLAVFNYSCHRWEGSVYKQHHTAQLPWHFSTKISSSVLIPTQQGQQQDNPPSRLLATEDPLAPWNLLIIITSVLGRRPSKLSGCICIKYVPQKPVPYIIGTFVLTTNAMPCNKNTRWWSSEVYSCIPSGSSMKKPFAFYPHYKLLRVLGSWSYFCLQNQQYDIALTLILLTQLLPHPSCASSILKHFAVPQGPVWWSRIISLF